MALRIDAVSTRRDMNDFLRVPRMVYRDDPVWVSPLDREVRRTLDPARNPYYRTATLRLFLARRDGVPVARIAVTISSEHARVWGERTAFFGFFECLNDEEAARALFTEAECYCIGEGVTAVEGPFNPCHYSEIGLQSDAYNREQRFFQTHNPEWYNDLLLTLGYLISSRKFTMRNADCRGLWNGRPAAAESVPASGGYRVRCFDNRHRERDLETMRSVFNDAFSDNWHFLPSSREEFLAASSMVKYVTDPGLVLFLENGRETAGVLLLVLDINPLLQRMHGRIRPVQFLLWNRRKRRIRTLIIYAVGIRKSHRGGRGYALLLQEAARIASRYETIETTWISEENHLARSAATHLAMTEDRHFAIYRKEIGS